MACGADGVQIHFQQRGAGLDLVAHLDQCLEAVAVHLHGVHANMDQDLHAVLAGQAHSVQGGSHLFHSAVKRSIHGLAGGLDAAAGAKDALCKGLVGDVGLCQHLAADGGQNGLALTKEFGGLFLLGLAAEQLIKKSHVKYLLSDHFIEPAGRSAVLQGPPAPTHWSTQKIPHCERNCNWYPA